MPETLLQEPGQVTPVQEPLVQQAGVVDLEQAEARFRARGEEPPPIREMIQKAQAKGYSKFRYRGQDFDSASPLEQSIQQPEPMVRTEPGTLPEPTRILDDLDAARRRRIGKAFVRERGVMGLPDGTRHAFLGYVAASIGEPGYEQHDAVTKILGLPDADRETVKGLMRDYHAFSEEQNLPLAPPLRLPFAGVSSDERRMIVARMAAVRPDNPAYQIVDWTAKAAGPEAQALLSVASNEARRAELEATLGTVTGTIHQPEGLGRIYHLLGSAQARQDPSLVGVARVLMETRASMAGIPFEPIKEIPKATMGYVGPTGVGPTIYPGLDKLIKETRELTRQTLEAELGPEMAEFAIQAYGAEENLLKAYANLFSSLDPSKIGVTSEKFDLGKVKNLQVLVEAMARASGAGAPMTKPEIEGEVNAATWFGKALSWSSRKMGDAVEAVTGDYQPLVWVFPDGAIFQDATEAGAYALSKFREDPEAYEWVEDQRLRAAAPRTVFGSLAEIWASGPSEGKVALKPTGVVVDVEGFSGWEAYDKVRKTEDRLLSEVLYERMVATTAPDATLTRGVAGVLSVGTEFADPLFLLGAGSMKYGATMARSKRVLEEVSKAAKLPESATAAGVRSAEKILKDAEMPLARESAQQVKGTTQRVILPDGKELAPALVPRYIALREMLGGSEDLAKAMVLGFKNDPGFFAKGLEALMADPLARQRVHSWMVSAGLNVQNAEEAARILNDLAPVMSFMMGHTSTFSLMDKMEAGYRGLLLGRAAMFEKARGVYLAGFPITPIITQPVAALVNPAVVQPVRKFRSWARNNPGEISRLKKIIAPILDSQGLIRSLVRYDTRKVSAPELTTQRLGVPVEANMGYYRLPPEMNDSLVRLRQNIASFQTQVDDVVADVVTAGGVLDVPGAEYRNLAPFLLELGDVPLDLATTRSVAGMREMKARIEEIHALPSIEQRMEKATEIMNSVTDTQASLVLRILKENDPITQQARGFFHGVGQEDQALGILTARSDYVTHIYYRTHGKGQLYDLRGASADGIVNRQRIAESKAKLSGFTLSRDLDTLFDAMVAGFIPETDLITLTFVRAQAHLRDKTAMGALREVSETYGELHPTQAAMMNILSDANPGFSGLGYGMMVKKNAARAEELKQEMESLAGMVKAERTMSARLERAAIKAQDKKALEPLMLESQAARAAIEQRVAEVGKKFNLTLDQQRHLAAHTTQGFETVRVRRFNLKKRLRENQGDAAARAELTVLDDQWGTYQILRNEFAASGIGDGEVAALTMELYGVPTLAHLNPGDGTALLNRMAQAKAALDVSLTPRFLVGDLTEAAELYKETRRENTYYARFVEEDQRAITGHLSRIYLPVEQILALRAYGVTDKAMATVDAGKLGALWQGWTKLMRGWKELVTIRNPSLSFGRRNQMDAMNKAWIYAGFAAASPASWKEFNAWRAGTIEAIVTGTGRFVDARKAWDDAKPLLQSYAGRIDALAVMRMGAGAPEKTGEQLAQRITERITRYAAARDPSRAWYSHAPGRAIPTGGRQMSAAERVLPYGPAVAEATDNTLRLWIYFMDLKAGRAPHEAIRNASILARDYSNMTPFMQFVSAGLPFTFTNFYKQNAKAMLEMMKRGDMGRMAMWPKLKLAIEADMPEEFRPEWSNLLDSIMGRRGSWNLPLDLGAAEVFSPVATLSAGVADALGITRGPGMRQRARAAGNQALDLTAPAFQALLGKERFTLRLPPDLEAQIMETVDDGDSEALGGLLRVHTVAGKPSLELSDGARVAAGLLGLNIVANSFVRHYDAFRHGDWRRWIVEEGGFAKYYPHQMRAVKRMGDYQDGINQRILDSFWALSDNGAVGQQIKADLTVQEKAFFEHLLQGEDAIGEYIGALRDMLEMKRPQRPSIVEPENN